jgi:transcriptional regulator MraZ
MLLGEYEHTIDDKNRLTLPAKFREELAAGVVVTRGMDGCVYAYPRNEWLERFQSRVGGLDPLQPEARKLQRHFFSGAAEAELDRQGRIMIPAPLLRYARLSRDVVVAGVHDHLEIWDREAWRRELTDVEGSAEYVAERLAAQRD